MERVQPNPTGASRLRAADARAQHKQQPAKPLHSGDLTGRNGRAPRANACTHRCSISAASLCSLTWISTANNAANHHERSAWSYRLARVESVQALHT